ncbi:TonB-dependent receptor [Mucilaginibacter ginkgonis]|uniref:TonB-dependent receptor n=1 Tax=Mucilaginibacter ginkgonis TaxID=2682091 RepID=A0A6I4HZS1_9SPHI|nr:TonB-dependent receptor [Mucilaginibacter ginkgonis]QQL48765.1 TonB-dependent receptor [Mucilaginibacter ginkgonis]
MAYKKIPLFLLVIVALAFTSPVIAQTNAIKNTESALLRWTDEYPQEKVYLHFDKPYYATGDDMWFKAYITVGADHRLSGLSAALNVELIDALDSVKQSIKLPVVAGVAMGDFALSDTLKPGNYRVRAYTNWMRNFGTDYFFDKTISIGGTAANSVYTRAAYSYSATNGQASTTATVTFSDVDGNVYANKEVSYRVVINGKTLVRGKGTTNNKGVIPISFLSPANMQFKGGLIETRIKTDAKTTLEKEIPTKAISSSVDVQFFPESGYLVYGLPSKVAFKAIASDGLGTPISGNITDNSGTEVAKITTQHLGMGLFMLVPSDNKTYKANLTFADGSQRSINLPVPKQDGYELAINTLSDPDNVTLRIYAGGAVKGAEISVVSQSSGTICYAARDNLKDGAIFAKIPKSHFPRGIVQFTLFDAAGNALNERLAFIDKPDDLKLDIITPSLNLNTRQKVDLGIKATDDSGKGMVASLSAAVVDNTKVPVDASNEVTILSSILLSSDIKGYIEKPNYYFENISAETRRDLDVLMLTQGYRRFDWKSLLTGNMPAKAFEPEKSITISGRVHTGGNKPVVGGKVTLFTTKGGISYVDTLTDKDGRFAFRNLVFADSVRFVIQARTSKNSKFVDIELDNTKPQVVTVNPNGPNESLSDTTLSYLRSEKSYYQQQLKGGVGNHNILLKEVIIRESRQPLKNSSNRNGPGQANQVLKSDELDKFTCSSLDICLQGRILGVTFRNGIPYSRGGQMQIWLDGFQIDADILRSINQYDIGSIEVLRSPEYAAVYGAPNGLLLINTKRGGETVSINKYTPGLITYMPKGYYQARQFYSPQYGVSSTNAALADLRTTIFWKPNIVTDQDGKASVDYFNAGSPGTYRVVVEGIDTEGHIGRKVLSYTVK